MLKHPDYTRTRIHQLVQRFQAKIYPERQPVTQLLVAGPTDRIAYADAQRLDGFRPAALGESFGPLWATHWFRVRAEVPAAWAGARVDVLWDSRSEATLWLGDRSVQGLNMTQGDRPDAILLDACRGGEALDFQVEMACNVKFGSPDLPDISNEALKASPFVLRRCEIARFDPDAWDLYWDAYVLSSLEADIARDGGVGDKTWGGHLLYELNRFCNVLAIEDRDTWPAARAILRELYVHGAADRTMELSVIGHAHIDTAWLWPLAETHRKCERTFSSATAYMRDYPEYRFACSQAYQYDAIRKRNPDLYARIRACIESGQWLPVGGTWIEPDCNIPSGESLCRQFLFGQRYFEREFGRRCQEFWNPDVFGYNGQLPQLMAEAGIRRFLTQKLSWNRFNKPPHHTFQWRGIDGTEVLTHFPPADSYNAFSELPGKSEVLWLRQNVRNFLDHDRSSEAILLYGFGDGGGGPTKAMLEVIRRTGDLQGVPRTIQRSSDEFFDRLEREAKDTPVVVGELYFEYHRGTYTSQALVKRHNRLAEQLLHDIEFLAVARGGAYPREPLDAMWKTLLLNQFHDILPGSSINLVYRDSERQFAELFARGTALLGELLGHGDTALNTTTAPRAEVAETNGRLGYYLAPPYGAGRATDAPDAVRVAEESDRIVLENGCLRAVFTRGGRLLSLLHKPTSREALAGEANVLELYEDRPTNYDAWDVDPYHLETCVPCAPADTCEITRQDPLRGEIRFAYAIGDASRLEQTVRLDAAATRLEFHCAVQWHETCRMLKVAFPVQVLAQQATYEMQFGHVERPTHYNTSYDLARYEVPMHRWFDLGEHGFGVAVLNDCKYGGSTYGNTMRLSLLRAPTSPDPTCDRGDHAFAYAIHPHAGNWRDAGVVDEAVRFNQPLRFGAALPAPFARVDDANLVLDTVKRAEDGEDVVLRFYERHGARGRARVRLAMRIAAACRCNTLEDPGEPLRVEDGCLVLDYRPHQIISVRVQPG